MRRVVLGLEPPAAEEVRHRVDAGRAVEEEGRADEEAPDEQLPAVRVQPRGVELEELAAAEDGEGEGEGDDRVEAVEEDELRILGQVAHRRVVGREIAAAGDPADVGPPEAVDMRRVGVLGLVGMLVMMPVMIGPPEGAALHRGGAEEGEEELADPRGAVGLVREVPVVDAGDREHADEVQGDGRPDREGTGSGPDCAQAAQVQDDKRDATDPIHAIRLLAHALGAAGSIIRVKPLDDGRRDDAVGAEAELGEGHG